MMLRRTGKITFQPPVGGSADDAPTDWQRSRLSKASRACPKLVFTLMLKRQGEARKFPAGNASVGPPWRKSMHARRKRW